MFSLRMLMAVVAISAVYIAGMVYRTRMVGGRHPDADVLDVCGRNFGALLGQTAPGVLCRIRGIWAGIWVVRALGDRHVATKSDRGVGIPTTVGLS